MIKHLDIKQLRCFDCFPHQR